MWVDQFLANLAALQTMLMDEAASTQHQVVEVMHARKLKMQEIARKPVGERAEERTGQESLTP